MPGSRVSPLERMRRWSQRKYLREAYQKTFGDPENVFGQMVLRHLMKVAHVYEPTYVQGDTHETAMREGARRLVLSIIREANIDEQQLQQMIEEHFAYGTE